MYWPLEIWYIGRLPKSKRFPGISVCTSTHDQGQDLDQVIDPPWSHWKPALNYHPAYDVHWVPGETDLQTCTKFHAWLLNPTSLFDLTLSPVAGGSTVIYVVPPPSPEKALRSEQ